MKSTKLFGAAMLVILHLLPGIKGQQACDAYVDPYPTCKETDPAGLVLASFNKSDPTENWNITFVAVPGYVELQLVGDTVKLFTLQPLDLEAFNNGTISIGSRFKVTLSCSVQFAQTIYRDVNILINAVNEFDPYFVGAPYNTSVEENSALGTTVFTLDGLAHDDDYNPSQDPISQFRLHSVYPQVPDTVYFSMTGTILGTITTQQLLDYEGLLEQGLTTFTLNVSAEDNGDPGPRSAFTTITVNIVDVDDENPVFAYHCNCHPPNCPPMIKGMCRVLSYSTTVTQSHMGHVPAQPAEILAVDGDMLNYTIEYGIISGTLQNYSDYFTMDKNTGAVNQLQAFGALDIAQLSLTLQATEVSAAQRNVLIGFTIYIQGRTNAPVVAETTTPAVYDTTEPLVEESKQDNGDSIALWVLFVVIGSCVLLVFVVALAVFLFLRKRHKKNVHPDDTQSSGPSNVSTEEEILDAYASETPETKWDHGTLDLSVQSGYSHNESQHSFMKGNAHKGNFMNGNAHQENISPRHFDIVVPLGRGNQLTPLGTTLSRADMIDTSTETEETEVRKLKKKPRRRRDRTKEVEIYDGTREYDMEADPSFFADNQKQRVKRNRRSFNFKPEPDHWITVPNEY